MPEAPINLAVAAIQTQLAGAYDLDQRPINQSVLLGEDAVMMDAISGHGNEEHMPAIRIFNSQEQHGMDNESATALYVIGQVSLYFLYYFGVPSAQTLPDSFQALRQRHIKRNLEFLKYKVPGNIGMDVPLGNTWKWVPQIAVCDHDAPLKNFGGYTNIDPATGFTCSRLDLTILVNNSWQV